jgi:phenylalanyl-tRNA synthetase beta chain
MAELAGGAVARGLLDAYPRRRKPVRVRLRMERVERVLGVAPKRAHARRILTGLGLAVRERGAILDVEVPSFRRDLAMEDDLAEEIIRVWGYDKIPSTLPGGQTVEVARESDRLRQEDLLRRTLAGAGLLETVTSSFTDRARNEALGAGEPLSLLNPLSQDAGYLRRHPLDGILGVVATNARRQQGEVRVFEIGKTYESSAGGDTGTCEPRWLALAVSGARGEPSWRDGGGAGDVYDAKGLAEHALGALGVRTSTRTGGALSGFEPDCHASLITASGELVAEFGEVAAGTRTALGIDAPVFAAAVRLDPLPWSRTFERYQALPRFPSVERDMAFVVPDPGPSAAAVEAAIRREAGPLLREVTVFDVFRLPDGQRSVAWRLTFQADDRTLTDEEINTIHGRVAARVGAELGLTLRGS